MGLLLKTFKNMELFEGHIMHGGNCFQLTTESKAGWAYANSQCDSPKHNVVIEKGGCNPKWHEIRHWKNYQSMKSTTYFTTTEFGPDQKSESVETPEAWGGVDAMHMITYYGKCVQIKGAIVRKAATDKMLQSKQGRKLVNGTCCNAGPQWCKKTFEHTKKNGMHMS